MPSLHKLYSLAAIYHLNPLEIPEWYEAPIQQTFEDGVAFPAQRTHLHEFPVRYALNPQSDSRLSFESTGLFSHKPDNIRAFPGMKDEATIRFRYGYIGLSDRRMTPILRPGSMVVVDTAVRNIDENDWITEYDRPFYFVETREGYRCG